MKEKPPPRARASFIPVERRVSRARPLWFLLVRTVLTHRQIIYCTSRLVMKIHRASQFSRRNSKNSTGTV